MPTCRTLRQWLADPAARLITLIGPGGVGKTRLALELARAIARAPADPRRVRAAGRHSRILAFVASAIAEALGLSDVTRARFAEARPRRVRQSADDAGARQFRAGAGRGAARRGSADRSSRRSDCWSPAARRSASAASGSMRSDRSRWTRARSDRRRPIWRARRPCGSSSNAFATCSPTFASRPRTARPWRRFAGGWMRCRSPSNSPLRGSKC